MGRYKMGPNGGYYDPNDSGPDQFTPTPGQQVPGMPQPQAPPQQSGGFQPPIDFPQFPRTPPVPSPNGWWDHAGENDIPGYDPNNRTPHEVQPTPYTGGYDPNSPMYGNAGSFGGSSLGSLAIPNIWSGQPLPDWMKGDPNQATDRGGWGNWKPSPPQSKLGGLGASLASLGVNGGNIAAKPSGGLAGAIFNKYPDLFKK